MTLRDIYELMGVVLACLALYVFLIQRSLPAIRGTRWVALSFLSGSAASWLIVCRGQLTPFLTETVAGLFAMLVNVFVYWGFSELLRLGRRSWLIVWTTVVPETLLLLWFTYVHNDVPHRIFFDNLFRGAQFLMLTVMLLRNGTPQTRLPRYTLAATYLFWTGYRAVSLLGPYAVTIFLPMTTPVTNIGPVARIFSALLTGHGFVWLAMAVLHGDLERQSNTDVLTGLLNRRAIEKAAEREMALSHRRHAPLAMILLDLDRFKSINDIHGHNIGDAALSLTGWCLRENLRNIDFIARLGGEEFIALLPDTTEATAQEIAERLRIAITELRIPNLQKPLILSASFGVTTYSPLDPTWEEMLRRGDKALYRAKDNGRNCVEVETVEEPGNRD